MKSDFYKRMMMAVLAILPTAHIWSQDAQPAFVPQTPGAAHSYQLALAVTGKNQILPDGHTFGYGFQNRPVVERLHDGPRFTDTLWTKNYGGEQKEDCYSVCQTLDGGFVMVGRANSFGAGDFDAWMVKTDANGEMEWFRTFGDTYIDEAYSVKQMTDGGYIISGMSTAFGWAGEGWLIRTDNEGNMLWSRGYHPAQGAVQSGWDYLYDVLVTPDGEVVAFGYAATEMGILQAWIFKADPDGDVIWEKVFGGEFWDRIFAAKMTEDGGFVGVGDTHVTYDSTYYRHDGWLIKFNAEGDTVWTRHFGADPHDIFRAVNLTADGGYIIAGERQHEVDGPFYGWMVKTDSLGNESWNSDFSLGALMAVCQADDGNFIGAGIILDDVSAFEGWLIKVDSKGNIVWEDMINGSKMDDMFLSMSRTADNGFILAGKHNSQPDYGDYWLVRMDVEQPDPLTYFYEEFDMVNPPDLPSSWSYMIDVMISNTFAEVKTTQHGGAPSLPNTTFIMNGLDGSNGQLDPNAFVALISPYARISESGATLTFKANGGNALQVGTMSDPSNPETFTLVQEVAITYDFAEYSVEFPNPQDTYIVLKHANTSGTTPIFMDNVLFEQNGTVGIAEPGNSMVRIYPNPGNGFIHISAGEHIADISVFSSNGMKVFQFDALQTNDYLLDCTTISAGYYFVRVTTTGGHVYPGKLLITK